VSPRDAEKGKLVLQVARYSTLGLEMGLSAAVGIGIGYYLDKWLGTPPLFLIIFLVMGIIAGFRALYRALKRLQREDEENR
jgi:ATP synthase protein I